VLTSAGLCGAGRTRDAIIQLRQPLVWGAVRVEYEAKPDEPGDLSLIMGTAGGTFTKALFFGVGSRGNTVNTIAFSKHKLESTADGLLIPGH